MSPRPDWIPPVALLAAFAFAGCHTESGGGTGGASTASASSSSGTGGAGGASTTSASSSSGTGGAGGASTASSSSASSSSGTGGASASSSSSSGGAGGGIPGGCLSSKAFGGAGFQSFTSVAVHPASGSLVVAGLNAGTVDLGGGPLTVAPGILNQLVIARLTPSLVVSWSKAFNVTGPASSNFSSSYVAVDAAGNTFVGGAFRGTVDFGGGPLVSMGQPDAFLLELDPAGNHLWSKRFGDSGGQYINAIGLDAAGNVIVAAQSDSAIDFGGGYLFSAGKYDVVVAKLDPLGNHIYSKIFGTPVQDYPYALAVDAAGRAIVGGTSEGTLSFGGAVLPSGGFVAALDGAGNHVWSLGLHASVSGPFIQGLAVDPAGEAFAVGSFQGSFSYGPGSLTSSLDQGQPAIDFFAMKLGAGGSPVWAQGYATHLNQQSTITVTSDSAGQTVLGGATFGGVDFGGGPLPDAASSAQVFAAKLDGAGNHLWSASFGDDKLQSANAVAVDATGALILVGPFDGSLDFGCGPLTSSGDVDMFIAKLAP